MVAVLEDDVVKFRQVKVSSTDGAVVSLTEGLKPGERIAINVPDEVTNGSRIQPIVAASR
jgi:multidrug efflux pump subunit AcrA (membrane-fusion protein)